MGKGGWEGKVHQGTCIKDTWTKQKGHRIRGWEVGMGGAGESSGGK